MESFTLVLPTVESFVQPWAPDCKKDFDILVETQQGGQGWSPWGTSRGLLSLEMAMGHLLLVSAT